MKVSFGFIWGKRARRLILSGYFLVFLFFVLTWVSVAFLKFNLVMEPIFYWILFVGLILTGVFLRFKSGLYLWIGFTLFVLGVFLFFITSKNASEFIFRNAFLFFLYGTTLSLIEYKDDDKRKEKKKGSF
jgi:hypothetical protein